MNRRSVLRWLGLAPVAAPASVAAVQPASVSEPVSASLNHFEAPGIQIWHPDLPKGMRYEAVGFGRAQIVDERAIRIGRDIELSQDIGRATVTLR